MNCAELAGVDCFVPGPHGEQAGNVGQELGRAFGRGSSESVRIETIQYLEKHAPAFPQVVTNVAGRRICGGIVEGCRSSAE
jgi:hypothetical protein